MTSRILIILIALSFVTASPALAVKKAPKKSAPSAGSVEQAGSSGQAQADEPRNEVKNRQEEQKNPPPVEPQPQRPDPQKIREKDRFIDENDDGINDGYRKPPTVKKKPKREESGEVKTGKPSRHRR